MSLGQAADVVVRLDRRGDALLAAGLDHVGVERSLHEERHAADPLRLLLEDADELLADPLALLLGIGDPLEPRQEPLLRLHVDERDVEVVLERLDHLQRLVLAQQAVVDEHARELVADRLVTSSAATAESTPPDSAQSTRAGRPARGSRRPPPR